MDKFMQGWQIIEEYKNGRRDFSGITISDGVDLGGANLSNAIFRNCKIHQARFSYADLTNTDFTGTHFYFCGFVETKLKNTKFDICRIEWVDFTNAFFDNTSMKNASLSFVGIIDANLGQIDLSNTSQFRVITSWSQVTSGDIELLINEYSQVLGQSQFERKLVLQQQMDYYMAMLKKDTVILGSQTQKNPYQHESDIARGYKQLQEIFDQIISYQPKNPYKSKNIYQKDGKN